MRATTRKQLTWISAMGLLVFIVAMTVQHALVPNADPAKRMLSEYVHSATGALTVIGFLAWSVSLAALARLTAASRPLHGEDLLARLQVAALVVTAAGLLLVGCFPTDRGAETPGAVIHATTTGHIHDAASALVTGGILVAAGIGAARYPGRNRVLTVVLLLIAAASSVCLLALGDPAPGLRQRLLVGIGCLWQVVWLVELHIHLIDEQATSPQSSVDSRCSTS